MHELLDFASTKNIVSLGSFCRKDVVKNLIAEQRVAGLFTTLRDQVRIPPDPMMHPVSATTCRGGVRI
jgi:hypothetical protein